MKTIELNHPLIQHKLAILRDKKTGTKEFRELISEIATFLCYEAMKDATLEEVEIETPITTMKTGKLNEDNYAFVPILRAGTGMLATGGSAIDAIELLKSKGVKKMKFLSIIGAPEGIERVEREHPDVQIYCAHIDNQLNENKYIVPGLGDAGDRIFGTK